jgi:hypothetical protein
MSELSINCQNAAVRTRLIEWLVSFFPSKLLNYSGCGFSEAVKIVAVVLRILMMVQFSCWSKVFNEYFEKLII